MQSPDALNFREIYGLALRAFDDDVTPLDSPRNEPARHDLVRVKPVLAGTELGLPKPLALDDLVDRCA